MTDKRNVERQLLASMVIALTYNEKLKKVLFSESARGFFSHIRTGFQAADPTLP